MYQSTKLIVAIIVTAVVPCILVFGQEHENLYSNTKPDACRSSGFGDIELGGQENLQDLMKLLSMPQKPERYVSPKDIKHPQPDSPMVTSFSWKSCNPADPIAADVLISPDPLTIPGKITITAKASLKVDVAAPVKVALTIKKKWIPIPFGFNVDVCAKLDTFFPPNQPCPDPFAANNLPCHCPFTAGDYSLPAYQVEVGDIGIPSWLTSGDYKIKAVASDSGGSELACYDATFTLT